jgi:predicted negative regulator of RcsB-dependent stress response
MADDFLTDDEQLEEVKRWFKEYAPWIVGGIVLGAGALFGWRYYESTRTDTALKAAAQFTLLGAAVQGTDRAKQRQLADGIIKDYPSTPYADQARLTLARIAVDGGETAKANEPLTQVMNQSKDSELKQIARLRLARVLIDEGKPDEAIKLLAEGSPGVYAGRYHEVRGDALLAKKDVAGAVTEYQSALSGSAAAGVDTAVLELKLADLGSPAKPNDLLVKAKP